MTEESIKHLFDPVFSVDFDELIDAPMPESSMEVALRIAP